MFINKNNKEKLNLKDWINFWGAQEISNSYAVSIHTVEAWKYGHRQPSVKQAKKIIKKTEGRLDYESIYGPISDLLSN
tara:strand:- start:374 stop:607 length:234 start_codon:yes stop_codon:yes gene_type:complete